MKIVGNLFKRNCRNFYKKLAIQKCLVKMDLLYEVSTVQWSSGCVCVWMRDRGRENGEEVRSKKQKNRYLYIQRCELTFITKIAGCNGGVFIHPNKNTTWNNVNMKKIQRNHSTTSIFFSPSFCWNWKAINEWLWIELKTVSNALTSIFYDIRIIIRMWFTITSHQSDCK